MSDCIFCKIIAGEIPSQKVYEDEQVFAFLDIQPVSRGHLLVVPKEHSENLVEMDAQLMSTVFDAARKLGQAAEQGLGALGFNIIVNKGEAAGQLVFHTHVHMIPRYDNDGLRHWPKIELIEEEMEKIATAIKFGI